MTVMLAIGVPAASAAPKAKPIAASKPVPPKILPAFEFMAHKIGDPKPSQPEAEVKSIGDIPLMTMYWQYDDTGFTGVSLYFYPSGVPAMRTTLTAKYGTPISKIVEYTNGYGAKFSDVEDEWHFREGTLTLQGVFGGRDMSAVTFDNPSATARKDAKAAAKARDAANAL